MNLDAHSIATILLATDFSEACRVAEARARHIAERCGATLVVVHGIEPIRGVEEHDSEEYDDFYRELLDRAEREMDERATHLGARNLLVKQHIRIGPRWRVVLDVAEEEGVDLIVCGRKSASEPVDNTTHRILFATNRSVLCVPLGD